MGTKPGGGTNPEIAWSPKVNVLPSFIVVGIAGGGVGVVFQEGAGAGMEA